MFRTRHQTISKKITLMNMLVSGAALLLACTAFIGYDMLTFRTITVRNLSAQARLISSNSISALQFNDPQSAEGTLAALKENSSVLSAVIYDERGRPFASYSKSSKAGVPSRPLLPAGRLEFSSVQNGEIDLVQVILVEGNPVGTIYIRSSTEELRDRLKLYVSISCIVIFVSLLAALLVSSIFRKIVAEPIMRLARVARVISHDKNYSLRVDQVDGKNELADLIDSFNEMLEEIQRGGEELHKAHDELEQRVDERTAQLVVAKEEVERTSKFKDQFLSTMSHELRTPLNAVLGFSEMLAAERYGVLNDRQRRYVNHIHAGGEHLLRLINDILDISKIEAGRLQLTIESVAVNPALEEIIESLQSLAEKKSQKLSLISVPQLNVSADFIRFKQIVVNLVGNAIKFTPEGGSIELRAHLQDDMVRIEVNDSGPGIPLEERPDIFKAFHRIRQAGNAAEGTGLGLAITRSLVELHGGELGLEGETGNGSCFYFTLPMAQVYCRENPYKPESGVRRSFSRTILVVDDELSAAQILESQLTSAGYKVVLCTEPQRAIEMALQLQPAAITLDVIMKPIGGWKVLSQLKSDPRTAAIPVVVVTIVDQKNTGGLLGASEYVVKPVDKTILLNAIDRCLNNPEKKSSEAHPVLIVEDHLPTREFIAEMLSSNGYSVYSVGDGKQARARMQDELPSLVILDLILPDVSGFQLLTEWRNDSLTAEIPVIVLTNKDLTPEERDYLGQNARALFQKRSQWQEGLLRHIRHIVPTALGEQS